MIFPVKELLLKRRELKRKLFRVESYRPTENTEQREGGRG